MIKSRSTAAAVALSLGALFCLAAPAHANDFPTQARVEFVLQCVKDYGGENYKNLYGCICMVDQIAERMSFAEYEEAETFGNMRTVPGERSGVFRENERGRSLAEVRAKAREEAASACLMAKPK